MYMYFEVFSLFLKMYFMQLYLAIVVTTVYAMSSL